MSNENNHIEAYISPTGDIPDVAQLEQSVLSEPSHRSRRGRVVAGAAAVAFVMGAGFTYDHLTSVDKTPGAADMLSDPRMNPGEVINNGEDLCYSPAAERSYPGDPDVISDNPADWTKGILVTVDEPKSGDYRGTRVGYREPEEALEDATWSYPTEPGELDGASALMRIGEGDFTLSVEYVAAADSDICDAKPIAGFQQVEVAAAIKSGAIEPAF
jgi:hypothetical protein